MSKEWRAQDRNENTRGHLLSTASDDSASEEVGDNGSFCDISGVEIGSHLEKFMI